uniref:Nonstructural protein 1 n=1 Tax=Ficedula parva densovirus TaxID=2794497 RepID=A0A8A4XCY9_9VIRU|nr:MAG: nonstructural protein 1 [Ficedula parva densovirus]
MTTLKDQVCALALSYKVFSKTGFLEKVPFSQCEKLLRSTEFEETLKIGLRLARKYQYDLENKNLYHYFRTHYLPKPSDFFENICNANSIEPRELAIALRVWLEKADKKKNTLKLVGIPNSGKTLIANLLRKVFICANWLNSSAGSAFNFGNLTYASLIIVEEPFLPPPLLEDFKSICGGASVSVDVKYSNYEALNRTPVLITSNFSEVSRGYAAAVSEQAINLRSYQFTFTAGLQPTFEVTPEHLLDFIQRNAVDSN